MVEILKRSEIKRLTTKYLDVFWNLWFSHYLGLTKIVSWKTSDKVNVNSM